MLPLWELKKNGSMTFPKCKNDQFYAGSICILAYLPSETAYCPGTIYKTYFQLMEFKGVDGEYLNCRILCSKATYRAKPAEPLSYTTSLENTKSLLSNYGFEGKYSEKTFKVSGVSEAVHQDVPLMDIMSHGRWRGLETPLIYMNKNKRRRLEISKKVV